MNRGYIQEGLDLILELYFVVLVGSVYVPFYSSFAADLKSSWANAFIIIHLKTSNDGLYVEDRKQEKKQRAYGFWELQSSQQNSNLSM